MGQKPRYAEAVQRNAERGLYLVFVHAVSEQNEYKIASALYCPSAARAMHQIHDHIRNGITVFTVHFFTKVLVS